MDSDSTRARQELGWTPKRNAQDMCKLDNYNNFKKSLE
jgi:hypothetical protein